MKKWSDFLWRHLEAHEREEDFLIRENHHIRTRTPHARKEAPMPHMTTDDLFAAITETAAQVPDISAKGSPTAADLGKRTIQAYIWKGGQQILATVPADFDFDQNLKREGPGARVGDGPVIATKEGTASAHADFLYEAITDRYVSPSVTTVKQRNVVIREAGQRWQQTQEKRKDPVDKMYDVLTR